MKYNTLTNHFLRIKSVFILLPLVAFGCSIQKYNKSFWSPYSDVNWKEIGYYDAEFHTHPGLGNEQYDPHQTIDRYHDEGYKIFSTGGHDYHIPGDVSIYPWTGLSNIYDQIKDFENPRRDNQTYAEMAKDGPYKNRNPVDLNMVSVEGCEVTGPHHMISLFIPCIDGATTEAATVQNIQKLGGLVYFAHPGRYLENQGLTEFWYADMYKRFDALMGQAVYNGVDRYPGDRGFYDKVVHILGIDRPIWLFGEDDMHQETTLAWNRNVVLLDHSEPGSLHPDIADGSVHDVKEALKNGYFYLWKPSDQYNKRAFNIKNIEVSDKKVSLEIDNYELVKKVSWMTFNPNTSETVTLKSGNNISIKDLPDYCRFVRAEIEGDEGKIYTQPFYIK